MKSFQELEWKSEKYKLTHVFFDFCLTVWICYDNLKGLCVKVNYHAHVLCNNKFSYSIITLSTVQTQPSPNDSALDA